MRRDIVGEYAETSSALTLQVVASFKGRRDNESKKKQKTFKFLLYIGNFLC